MKKLLYGIIILTAVGINVFNSNLNIECRLSDGDISGSIEYGDGGSWRFSVLSQGGLPVSTATIRNDILIIPEFDAGFLVFRVPILE